MDTYKYFQIDKDGNGYIDIHELKEALDVVGFKVPQWRVRQMVEEYDKDQRGDSAGKLSFDEFQCVCRNIDYIS